MADLDPIGPLKPAVPPAKRNERQRRQDRRKGPRKTLDEDGAGDDTDTGSEGSDHQVDEYA